MNLDERGRSAGAELRRVFGGTERFGAAVELERLHSKRSRRARRQRWRACEREPLPLNTARQAGLRFMRWRRMQAAVVFSSGMNWPHRR